MSEIVFYHSPNTRSGGTRILLEELGASYTLKPLNMKAGEQRHADYLAVNPMGKVPAIRHGDALITEQVAIYLYLADLFPEAGLAPAIGDPLRGHARQWRGADRSLRYRARLPSPSGAKHFRAVSSFKSGRRIRPWLGDRRRSDRSQRRLDRAGAAATG